MSVRRTGEGFWVRHRLSTDSGVTWSSEWSKWSVGALHEGLAPQDDLLFPYQGILQLAPDTWLAPAYFGYAGAQAGARSRNVIGLFASTDGERTWTLGNAPFISSTKSFTEATVAQRADGRLVMIGRYDYGQPKVATLAARVSARPVRTLADLTRLGRMAHPWSAPELQIPGVPRRGSSRLSLPYGCRRG